MTSDVVSLENQLRQRPHIIDAGFSQAVMARITARQRRRRRALITVWMLTAVAALVVLGTQLEAWTTRLQPLSAKWTTYAEAAVWHLSDSSPQSPLQLLFSQQLWQQPWQSSGVMVIAGLLAVLLTAAYAAAWD